MNRRRILPGPGLTLLLFVSLVACNPRSVVTTDDDIPDIAEVGGSRDEHGCLSSGGYQWSVALEKCVRLWEVSIELKNAKRPNAATVGYLIIDPEKDKAELYLPEFSGSLILTKDDNEWADSEKSYTLKHESGNGYQLYNSRGTLIYYSTQ